MQVYDDYLTQKIDEDCFYRILRFIQTFAIRRFILDLPTNSFNKIFMVLYDKIDDTDYEKSIYRHILSLGGKQRMPNDDEIKETLKDKDIYKIGICFSRYGIDNLPTDENDVPMDMIITEAGYIL